MIKKLPKKTVVMVGGGLTAGLAARQLTDKNIEVLVLERGGDRTNGAEAKLPSQRDELRWDTHQGLVQDWSVQTYTLRYNGTESALPARWIEAFLPGEGMGGAANHWNGHTWRWSEYDPQIKSRNVTRYGKSAIPKDVPLQDWGVTYVELRPYHELFEKLFGLSGKAGNINGIIQPGGNPFEAPRDGEYPQKPLEFTEAGLIFKATAENMGYKPFPTPAANSSGVYTNPDGQKLGQCQYCGHCERFICEANAKSDAALALFCAAIARFCAAIARCQYAAPANATAPTTPAIRLAISASLRVLAARRLAAMKNIDAVIAALHVALKEAERSQEYWWKVRAANRWINQMPGAWVGRWWHLRLQAQLGLDGLIPRAEPRLSARTR